MADKRVPKTFTVEGAQIIFRNFAGVESQYNRAGDRNFACVVNRELADALLADGWNVKQVKQREEDIAEGAEPTLYVPVEVSFKVKPPNIWLVSGGRRERLVESQLEILDWIDIENVDLKCNGYDWDVNGKQGVKAYLKSIYITIEEDDLDRKYAEMTPS